MTAPLTFSSEPVDSNRANAGTIGFRRTPAARDAAVALGSCLVLVKVQSSHDRRCALQHWALTARESLDANILEILCGTKGENGMEEKPTTRNRLGR